MSFVVDKVYKFNYSGGSIKNRERIVLVQNYSSFGGTIQGFDFTIGAVRNFTISKMQNLVLYTNYKVVDSSQLPTVLAGALENAWVQEGYKVVKSNVSSLVFGVQVPKTNLQVTKDAVITIEGPGGKAQLNNPNGRLSLYVNGSGVNFSPSDPLPFFLAIKKVLGVN